MREEMLITKDNFDMIKMFLDELYQNLSLKNKKLLEDNFGVDCLTDILNDCGIIYFEEENKIEEFLYRKLTELQEEREIDNHVLADTQGECTNVNEIIKVQTKIEFIEELIRLNLSQGYAGENPSKICSSKRKGDEL